MREFKTQIRSAALFHVMVLAIAQICTILFSSQGWAAEWPGRRRPTLIERWKAELIVFADVVKTQNLNGGQLSRLSVISCIKSDDPKTKAEIKVFIPLGSHWPYTFTRNGKALAFLKYDKEQDMYVAYESGDGGLTVDENSAKTYLLQYAKLPKILKEEDPRSQFDQKLAWNVELATYPKARSEASHGIQILWKKAKKQKLLTASESVSVAKVLTNFQKRSICQSLANELPDSDSRDIIELLKSHPAVEIDIYLLRSLQDSLKNETAVPLDHATISDLAFELLPERIGFELTPVLESRYENYQRREEDYTYHISIGEEYTDAERQSAREALITEWRRLAREFLKTPELQKYFESVGSSNSK